MFIALDKLYNQGVRQAIIVVPERSIGGSFANEPLSDYGFFADWTVEPQWNLCNAPGIDEPRVARSKVKAVGEFLASDDHILICTHATFRFAVDELGVSAFDNRLIAVDEFHHVSSNPDNRLGSQLGQFIERDKVHVVAMTGSYFRGDSVAVLAPHAEARFETMTYTYYEQLNGYEYLNAVMHVLDPSLKTIVHISRVNARESQKEKHKEVESNMDALGEWKSVDDQTGFHLINLPAHQGGHVIKVADLVDDGDAAKRTKVLASLKDSTQRHNRDHVDIIIALGMAKEGFDWIWCEHALTIGYRSSLTEIVQIIGRATRDAPGKERARFTNLIAEPDASEATVVDAVNDTMKAIAASLLMEQVLAPRFDVTPRDAGPQPGADYGEDGYLEGGANVGVKEKTGQYHVEIKGLAMPESAEASRICQEDLNEVITACVQDNTVLERGLFDQENTLPEELTQLRMGKIVRERYPELSDSDQEAVRQHAIATLALTQQAKQQLADATSGEAGGNLALIQGVRKFVNVRDLDIDLIDRINPFAAAYAVLAKAMDEKTLLQVQNSVAAKRIRIPPDEARDLAKRALLFKQERGRLPDMNSPDPWEKRMAEGVAAFARYLSQQKAAEETAGGS